MIPTTTKQERAIAKMTSLLRDCGADLEGIFLVCLSKLDVDDPTGGVTLQGTVLSWSCSSAAETTNDAMAVALESAVGPVVYATAKG